MNLKFKYTLTWYSRIERPCSTTEAMLLRLGRELKRVFGFFFFFFLFFLIMLMCKNVKALKKGKILAKNFDFIVYIDI